MIIIDVKQNEPEWDALRLGTPSASKFKEIVTATGKHSASRLKYMQILAGERITGRRYTGKALANFDRGHANEPESRAAYEIKHGVKISQPGFVFKDELKRFGCSPDGFINDNSGFETKDAEPHVQLARYDGWTFAEHHRQIHGSMMITGFDSWVLRSYCSGMKPIDIIVERDDAICDMLENEVNRFCDELDALVRLRS